MQSSINNYTPITLSPSEVRVLVIETMASTLPLFDVSVIVDNFDTNTVNVNALQDLVVSGVAMGFNGSWSRTLTTQALTPDTRWTWDIQSGVDGVMTAHRIVLTNTSSSSSVKLHVMLRGVADTVNAQITTTQVIP